MVKRSFTVGILIVFITGGFFKVAEIQAERNDGKFSSKSWRTFNTFGTNSWFNYPSQFMQYWFPMFQPAYFPSFLQRPRPIISTSTTSTTPPSVESENEAEITIEEDSKSKTDNIFGIYISPDENVEYLPEPSKIEW